MENTDIYCSVDNSQTGQNRDLLENIETPSPLTGYTGGRNDIAKDEIESCSSDDDETLSNTTETGDAEFTNACQLKINCSGKNSDETKPDCNYCGGHKEVEVLLDNVADDAAKKCCANHENHSVFYLEPEDWQKSDRDSTVASTSTSSSPLLLAHQEVAKTILLNSTIAPQYKNCQQLASNRSIDPFTSHTFGVKQAASLQPLKSRLQSPLTIQNPLLSRLHHSESMQTLHEYESYNFRYKKKAARVRSYSSSSNPKSCYSLYRQSFGSGTFSGPISPRSLNTNACVISPIKRRSTVNDFMAMPTNGQGNSHNSMRRQLFTTSNGLNGNGTLPGRSALNSGRQRKTAIPVLCSRAAVMVSSYH